jgi:hypothetical protein
VQPILRDLDALLIASGHLLSADKLNIERLKAWRAERETIFCRLKSSNWEFSSTDLSGLLALLGELQNLDRIICGRVIEMQRCLGEQIAAARKIRQALSLGNSRVPQLLQQIA